MSAANQWKANQMAHNLEMNNGVYSFAFTGERSEIWHRLGQELRRDVPGARNG